jgi:rubrerythrin
MRHIRSIEDILNYAIERETEANIFYKKLATIVKKPDLRATIKTFALDEYRHKLLLEGIKDGHLTFTYDEIEGLGLADSLDDPKPNAEMNYKELLAFAIKKEDKAHRMYTQLAQCSKLKEVKELFTQLAHEEAEHRFGLEFEYDLISF